MVGAVALGHLPGKTPLVKVAAHLTAEAHADRIDRVSGKLAHQGDDGARVDAAAEEGPERHLAHQVHGHRLPQEFHGSLEEILLAFLAVGAEPQVPVPAGRPGAVPPGEIMSGQKFFDILEDRHFSRDVGQGEVGCQGLLIHFPGEPLVGQDRFHLRGETEPALVAGVEEGLDAEPVPTEKEHPRGSIPDREGEHTPELVDAGLPPFLVGMKNGFRVAVGGESVAEADEPPAQLVVVVDLAVEDDALGPVLVEYRLMTACHVDNAQAAVAEPDTAVEVVARVVGTTVGEGVGGSLQEIEIRILGDYAKNSAHGKYL